MIKSLVQILKNPLNALFLLIIIFIIFPILIGIFLGENLEEKLKIFLITFVISIIIFELLFRFLYRLYTGSKYMFIKDKLINLFPFKMHGHYTVEGYRKVANRIYDIITQ